MAKLTLEQLRALREQKRAAMRPRETTGKEIEVIIGMGTCGIAAGAKLAFDAILDEANASGLGNVIIRQTGCMGLCYSEPTVEVRVPDMPTVVYGRVDAEVGRKIVRKHLIGRQLINDHIYDKPSVDIVR